MDASKFLEALGELEAQKGISKESILTALKEAIRKAYVKSLGGGDDADVRIVIDEEKGIIDMKLYKKVVEDVQDDYLEISVEDAKKDDKKLKAGDEWSKSVPVEEMARITALTVKSVLRQKLVEAEKLSLYETYKDKTGEMISGIVEKCDDHGAMVNVGRSSLYLSRKDLIGDEIIPTGTPIRLYVSEASNTDRGPMVHVSRSDAGFLKCIFEEEVREIYDGTVIIKAIAREAGIRAKVAVYSNDPNVDCVGACIGVNGAAIQRIVSQLGAAKEKEKIDIISYSNNDALFIIDALRPATVTHIHLDEENKQALVIVPNGQLSLAIGRKGANARVACRLTNWKIDIKEEQEIPNLEVELKSVEQIQEEEKVRSQKEKYEKYLAQVKASRAEEEAKQEAVASSSNGVEKAKPQKITEVFEEEKPVQEEVKVEEVSSKEEPTPVEVKETPKVEETKVHTTTTLESLEAALESDKKKDSFKATQKSSRRPRKITEEEVEHEELKEEPVEKKVTPQMDIYTKEELEELEEESMYDDEDYIDDEDIDYDDFDKYYDDDDK